MAIEGDERSWTYQQLDADVRQLAAEYADHNGHVVLLRWPNEVELLIHMFALLRAGAVVAPVKARIPDAEVQAIAVATGATRGVAAPGLVLPILHREQRDLVDDTAVLLCTSGTSGHPKAAALTHRGLLAGFVPTLAVPLARVRGPRAGRDAVLTALPLCHVMGLAAALGSLVAGVPWVHRSRFDAHAILDLMETRRPNAFIGVPTMYADLEAAGAESRDLSSIQLWVSAADAMPTDRARRFQTRGASVILRGRPIGRAAFVDTSGMVELSGAAAIRVIPPISVNLPVPYRLRPGLKVRAVGSEGQRLRLGAHGELQFRGAGVMLGYRGRHGGLTDGWLSTGDHGRVLPGGLFTMSGRDRDRLKVGGFSVFPAEVEAVLDTYPSIREVAVVGVPDPRLGESLVALVVASKGFEEVAFLEWAGANLSGYRSPRSVIRGDGLPRGHNDKLDRDAATELARSV
jgi:acyl-CoA synthetase (AMP-forming)/AMP-acid ligase II